MATLPPSHTHLCLYHQCFSFTSFLVKQLSLMLVIIYVAAYLKSLHSSHVFEAYLLLNLFGYLFDYVHVFGEGYAILTVMGNIITILLLKTGLVWFFTKITEHGS